MQIYKDIRLEEFYQGLRGEKNEELLLNGYKFLSGDSEKALKIVAVLAQHCECNYCH